MCILPWACLQFSESRRPQLSPQTVSPLSHDASVTFCHQQLWAFCLPDSISQRRLRFPSLGEFQVWQNGDRPLQAPQVAPSWVRTHTVPLLYSSWDHRVLGLGGLGSQAQVGQPQTFLPQVAFFLMWHVRGFCEPLVVSRILTTAVGGVSVETPCRGASQLLLGDAVNPSPFQLSDLGPQRVFGQHEGQSLLGLCPVCP